MSYEKSYTGRIADHEARCFRHGVMTVRDGMIEAVTYDDGTGGDYLLPGLVDAHTHGRVGLDFSGASEEELCRMLAAYAQVGSTTVAATIATAPLSEMADSARRAARIGMKAVHYEGRYLNPVRKGAHAPWLLAGLDADEMRMLTEAASPCAVHFTVAPELEGGEAFIRGAVALGATVGAGHTNATYEEIQQALSWGVTSFTHTYNAMSPFTHRGPGAAGASLLCDDAWSEFICDGVHLHPAAVALAYRLKPRDRFVLITDSMAAAGLGDGDYRIAGLPVRVREGHAALDDGTIAGSTLDLYDGMLNLMAFAGASFYDAVRCATLNPARMLGIGDQCASLTAGRRADFIIAGEDYARKAVFLGGAEC